MPIVYHRNALFVSPFFAHIYPYSVDFGQVRDRSVLQGGADSREHRHRQEQWYRPPGSYSSYHRIPSRIGTLPHTDHPFGFRHLLPEPTQAGGHFDPKRGRDNHQISLAGAGPGGPRARTRETLLWRPNAGADHDSTA